MELKERNIIVTGAGSGIGGAVAIALAERGASLVLVGRNRAALEGTAAVAHQFGVRALVAEADLINRNACQGVVEYAARTLGGIDGLVNVAGVSHFGSFQNTPAAEVEQMVAVNVTAPMILTQAAIPHLLERPRALVVNVGSVFDSIGFPYYAAYSATKFALRGFSQALRRELRGTGIRVVHVSPRATRTPLNSPAVMKMAAATKMAMDEPATVAAHILRAMELELAHTVVGSAEGWFCRINSLVPGVVDRALDKQARVMARFAGSSGDRLELGDSVKECSI